MDQHTYFIPALLLFLCELQFGILVVYLCIPFNDYFNLEARVVYINKREVVIDTSIVQLRTVQ